MSKLFLYFCFPISKRFHNFSAELKKINIFGFLRRLNFFGGDIICETHLASTNQMWSHMLPSLVKYRHANVSTYSFQRYCWSKNLTIWLAKKCTLPTHNHSDTLKYYRTLWSSLCKNSNIPIDSFQRYWWSKNSAIWLDVRHIRPQSTKSSSLRCCFPLMLPSFDFHA